MGTLSKRPLRDFGVDIRERIDDFRTSVGGRLDKMQSRVEPTSRHEGAVTKVIEKVAASLPSTTWLVLAGASLVGSIGLGVARRNHLSIFVGQWAPTFLILGLYNKLVKAAGSDRKPWRAGARGNAEGVAQLDRSADGFH
jgi:hypothetical protein